MEVPRNIQEDVLVIVLTVHHILDIDMEDGTTGTIMFTVVSLVGTVAAEEWIKTKKPKRAAMIGCLYCEI